MAGRDMDGSPPDTYAIVSCGGLTFNERDSYQADCADPKFHKRYEFSGKFPGCMPLTIECWDHDFLFGDDLIGKTNIDLDDRFFNPEWMALEQKPIERRALNHPQETRSQGEVYCWVEIDQQNKGQK